MAVCSNERIRERLLQEHGNKALEDLENLALTMERAQRARSLLRRRRLCFVVVVGSIRQLRLEQPEATAIIIGLSSASSWVPCINCGRAGHASKADTCPAHGKTCDLCGKLNHFASVCCSSGQKDQSSSSTYGQAGGRHRQRSQSGHRQTNLKRVCVHAVS